MAVRLTYWLDPNFTVPLECCESDIVPPANFFVSSDKFERANSSVLGNDEQGRRWIIDTGTWDINARTLRTRFIAPSPENPSAYNIVHVEGASAADASAEATLAFNGDKGFLGIVLRFRSVHSYYSARIDARGLIDVEKRSPQFPSGFIGDGWSTNVAPAQSLRLGFRSSGDLLEVLVNGAVVLSVIDQELTESGYVGLFASTLLSSVGDVLGRFDNWYAEGDG